MKKNKKKEKKSFKGKKSDRRVKKNLNAIYSAFREILNKKTIQNITMEEIAEKADISKATLYKYFHNKGDILLQIGCCNIEQHMSNLQRILSNSDTGLDTVIILSKEFLKYSSLHIEFFYVVERYLPLPKYDKDLTILKEEGLNQSAYSSIELSKIFPKLKYFELLRNYNELWIESIRKGIHDGSIKSNLKLFEISNILFIFIHGIAQQILKRKIKQEELTIPQNHIFMKVVEIIRNYLSLGCNCYLL